MQTTSRYASRTSASLGEGYSFIALRFGTCNFSSVTVAKEGLEISVSSHFVNPNKMKNKLMEFERAYTKETLLPNSSEMRLTEHQSDVPDLLPTQGNNVSSVGKDTQSSNNEQGSSVKNQESDAIPTDEEVGITQSNSVLQGEEVDNSRGDNESQEQGGTIEVDTQGEVENGLVHQGAQGGVKISDEVDEDGSPFVKTSTGTTVFGEIKKESGLTPAPIKLSLGNSKYGLIHLEKRHGDQIRGAGFDTVEDFVEFVCKNYKQIKQGENSLGEQNGTYLIQIEDEHNNTL